MSPVDCFRCTLLAGLIAASAGCTQATGHGAPRPATDAGSSLPAHVSENPVGTVPSDADAAAPNDASTADPPVADAGSESTGRQFPDIDYGAFPPPPTAPLCPSGGMLKIAPTDTLFRLGASDAILGSVSPDGLSVAWTIPGSGSRRRPTAVFVADRASTSDAFGSPQAVDFGATLVAPDKVALSPDRSRLVAVRSDLLAFVELNRSAPTDPFGSPSEASFAAINAVAQATNAPLGDPTLAGDDRAFFYTRALAVIESNRSSTEPWPEGSQTSLEYSLNPGQRPRLSAVSEDHLTLFFWDDQQLVENATWRISPNDPFHMVIRLPLVPRAQPSASCTDLFFASTDPTGLYLARATATFGP